jgi:hypothetical protein
MQPAFTLADQNRCRQSYRLLQATVEDSRRAQMRLITARDRSNVLTTELSSLDARIAALTQELESKRRVLSAAREEVDDMALRIQYNLDKRNGLCIRYVCMLPRAEMTCCCVEAAQRRAVVAFVFQSLHLSAHRCLENKALKHVLSFLGKTPSSYLVCKYWKVCVDEMLTPPEKKQSSDAVAK